MIRYFSLLIFLFSFCSLVGQELPPVVNFGPNQYSAGNQNWMIDQAENKNLYFANSTGLLEYNGENWELYPVPNNTIVRSLKVVGERVYTGAYMEAGYWEKDEFGRLKYESLVPKFPNGIVDGEQFWDIEYLDDLIIFRSFNGIYFYDAGRDDLSQMENIWSKPFSGIFKLGEELYFQLVGEGLFKMTNGDPEIIIPPDELGEIAVMHLYYNNAELRIISGKSEFLRWDGQKLTRQNTSFNEQFGFPNILDAIDLDEGGLVLGTVGKGVIRVDSKGKPVNVFNQENILLNNTVLDLFKDDSGNIWAGLDYGISQIDLESSFRSFQDIRGEIGSVYASFQQNGNLYLGTNQGLYLRKENEEKFQIIDGTEGQVWFIDKLGGILWCGHNSGTFRILGDKAVKVCDRLGTWLVKKYADDVFIQGHYNGISFIRISGEDLEVIPMLKDFPHSSKFIEVKDTGEIWIGNEHKGVFQIRVGDSLAEIENIKNYEFTEESGITSSIFEFNDTLYYSSKENIYKYDPVKDLFSKQNELNFTLDGFERVSGKMVSEENKAKLWGFGNEGIFYIKPGTLSRDYDLRSIYIDQDFRNIAVGYENISNLEENDYLLGIANGYLRIRDTEEEDPKLTINLDLIEISALDAEPEKVVFGEEGNFNFDHNNINFSFSAPVHDKYLNAVYSYRLVGLSSNWSEWTDSNQANFKNLNFGEYRFEVRARVGKFETPAVSYNFTINRPYYLSNLALVGYFLSFVLILVMVHLFNKRHHKKMIAKREQTLQLKNLEAEKEIIKLQNEKLEQDMANKNRELAVSTMSLIKKNEFLTSIKEKLQNSGDSSKVSSVIKTIDKDISEEDNWKFFKKAFNSADKDFFKKIKARHPELTSNDLKLCAYLRLNLSSKEIAPLLNISVKSVEIKRYRLRKKMDLDRETNLTEYILAL
ncbi:histidine kinase [Gramella lutea]|uniref:Histidine kinase n=1 Tax=Christiangramia lutea TaxID=1607951 RepID=A0A9X1V3Q4_9FLAO|nr:triple tyrosine motif-containing protein [Christiangramia lutea]MCH4822278.1 histidine kinase [Christiangramia lutea]